MSRSNQVRREPLGRDHVFRSGKYAGLSVGEVLEHNAAYIVWLSRNTDIDFSHDVLEEAEDTPTQT